MIIATATNVGAFCSTSINVGDFRYVFIDEGGQLPDNHLVISLSAVSKRRTLSPFFNRPRPLPQIVVIAGDFIQLGPVVDACNEERLKPFTKEFSRGTLKRMSLERDENGLLVYDPYSNDASEKVTIDLNTNYRGVRELFEYEDERFYGGRLIFDKKEVDRASCAFLTKYFGGNAHYPVRFVHTSGSPTRDGTSSYNMSQVELIMSTRKALLREGFMAEDIGDLSYYAAQRDVVKTLVDDPMAEIGVTETWQSNERDIMLVSTVKDRRTDFLASEERFATAMTRAKKMIIVFGNMYTLMQCDVWKGYIDLLALRGALYDTRGSNVVAERSPVAIPPATPMSSGAFRHPYGATGPRPSSMTAAQQHRVHLGGGATRPYAALAGPSTRGHRLAADRGPNRPIIGAKEMPKDLRGQRVVTFGKETNQEPCAERSFCPVGCAKDPWSNEFLICDTQNNVVKIFDARSTLKRVIHGNLRCPTAVVTLNETTYAVRDDFAIHLLDNRMDGLVKKCAKLEMGNRGYGLAVDVYGKLITLETSPSGSCIAVYEPSSGRLFGRAPFASHLDKDDSKCSFIETHNDDLFVTDFGANRIYQIDIDTGESKKEFGGQGIERGRFAGPTGISANLDGNLFVGDYGNDRVQIFSTDGDYVGRVIFDYPIKRPTGIHLTLDGHLMVTSRSEHYGALFKLGPLYK